MTKHKSAIGLLILTTALIGCGKDPATEAASAPSKALSKQSSSALALFDKTSEMELRFITEAGSELLRKGIRISDTQAENCIRGDEGRMPVKELCGLLVAQGPQDVPDAVKSFITEAAKRSPVVAAAFVVNPALLKGTSYADVLSYLAQLKAQPSWVRSRLLFRWADGNGGLSSAQLRQALDSIRSADTASPLSLSYFFAGLAKYDQSLLQGEAKAYCREGVTGDVQIRCWRLLSALYQTPFANQASTLLQQYRPNLREESFTIFNRSLPQFAATVTKTFNSEK
jgi:hypothetical protein